MSKPYDKGGWSNTINRLMLHKSLNLKDKIPGDYAGFFAGHSCPNVYGDAVVIGDVIILKTHGNRGRGKAKHRVFVGCPKCLKAIPAGRWAQHSCAETVKKWIEGEFAVPKKEEYGIALELEEDADGE